MRSMVSCSVSVLVGSGPAVSHVTSMPHSGRSNSAQSRRSRLRSQEPNELLSFRTISCSLAGFVSSGITAHMMSRHLRDLAPLEAQIAA